MTENEKVAWDWLHGDKLVSLTDFDTWNNVKKGLKLLADKAKAWDKLYNYVTAWHNEGIPLQSSFVLYAMDYYLRMDSLEKHVDKGRLGKLEEKVVAMLAKIKQLKENL